MLKAILFDMDGVIIDSRKSNKIVFREAFKKFGLDFPKGRERLIDLGGTDPEIIRLLSPSLDGGTVAKIANYIPKITSDIGLVKLNPGVKWGLSKLHGKAKLAIVSNDNCASVKKKLRKFGILKHFDAVVTADEVKRPKPHAEPILKALKLLGVKRKDALYLGDNEVDRLAGKAAGVRTIASKRFFNDRRFFTRTLPALAARKRADVLRTSPAGGRGPSSPRPPPRRTAGRISAPPPPA